MSKLRFSIERVVTAGVSDSALILDGETPTEALMMQVWSDLSIDVDVTVGGVTMFAAAWEDPEHWASDWAEKLNIDADDVSDAVAGILAAAIDGR